jgi:hypothetical protein
VSKLEHAVTAPSTVDIKVWCKVCGVHEQTTELIAALHAADSLWLDWRRMERAGLRPAQESVRALYERTRLFRFYSSVMIPGPVQTAPYVRAVLSAIRDRRGIADDVEEAVAERIDRQHIVQEGDHRFAIVLEESTLRTVLGGPEVMAGQLGHLLAVTSRPSVSLGIRHSNVKMRRWSTPRRKGASWTTSWTRWMIFMTDASGPSGGWSGSSSRQASPFAARSGNT